MNSTYFYLNKQYLHRKSHVIFSYNKTFLFENPSFDSIFVSGLRIDDYKFDLNERIIWIQEIPYCDIDLDKEYTRCSMNKNESTLFLRKRQIMY